MPAPGLVCPLCGRGFRRTSHLRRHENEHSSVDYPCQFCPKRFSRRDVARRHAVACPRRQGQVIRTQKRGRKPIACESCSEAKLSCDHKSPCRRCSSRQLSCTYRSASDEAFGLSPLGERLITHSEPASLSFLLHVTSPTPQSITHHRVSNGTMLDGSQPCKVRMTTFCRPQHPCSDPNHTIVELPEVPNEVHRNDAQHLMDFDPFSSSISSADSVTVLDSLQARLSLMLAEVQWTSIKSIAEYAAFFTSAAYSLFIPAIAEYRQWQWSIIHWPTVCLEDLSSPLLLTLGLSGAALIEVRGGMNTICALDNSFYEIVETYVFDCLETAMNFHDHARLDTRFVETCQAALLVIAVENGIDDCATKRRLLTKRLPSLVAAIRMLNIAARLHPRGLEVPSWTDFVRREACIRLVTWTFLQDALFTLLCCHPPSLTAVEMICDLPCNELLWAAESEPDFKIEWGFQHPSKESFSLKQAIWWLLGEDSPNTAKEEMATMSADHLFILIWGKLTFLLVGQPTMLIRFAHRYPFRALQHT